MTIFCQWFQIPQKPEYPNKQICVDIGRHECTSIYALSLVLVLMLVKLLVASSTAQLGGRWPRWPRPPGGWHINNAALHPPSLSQVLSNLAQTCSHSKIASRTTHAVVSTTRQIFLLRRSFVRKPLLSRKSQHARKTEMPCGLLAGSVRVRVRRVSWLRATFVEE